MSTLPASLDDLGALPPIPELPAFDTSAYRSVPVDLTAPEQQEPLVDIADFDIAGEAYYNRTDGQNLPYGCRLNGAIPRVLVRSGVAERLRRVNDSLAHLNLELFVWDAYRPVETQAGLWAFFETKFRHADPNANADKIEAQVRRYVSDPRAFLHDDPTTWPTHLTGASVDLTLRNTASGALLEMGAHFDQMEDVAQTVFFESSLRNGEIAPDDRRLLHRRLLFHAMTKQGFTNYPQEFWHFDFGNQMYQLVCAMTKQTKIEPARYGAVFPN
ncbi:M15 family metallopeptidase [Actibacterium pelagium]|uniref:D-alanyl-D-alanine dipeptidase n=1 Tax=Actibacterium pelagium TaxID=2029103 RepID=A0A917EH92_9RHOB|nr:M15 family metallopeptidase [Actibacterium pelagium]GGE41507.1 hypothetical protein GCM10011517_06390 [Actibacterium pelagium]